MSTDRDTTRIVRSWLRTDEHESANRVVDDVLALLDTTPQRRSWWPARRISDMNNLARLAIAAAAVVVVAVVGINMLPGSGGVGGSGPTPVASPSPTTAPSASPLASQQSSQPTPAAVLPPAGKLAIGRHDLMLNGVSFSLAVPSGWNSNGTFGIDKDSDPGSFRAGFIFWNDPADGIFSDPCTQKQGPPVGPSGADLASAIANMPGTTAIGPTDVTVGGYPAKLVVVKIPDVAACAAQNFYLWWDEVLTGRYATELGSTIRVWIIDVNGTLIQLDGETSKDAGADVGQEVQQIVDSIQFK
jgi:hypothetical protein